MRRRNERRSGAREEQRLPHEASDPAEVSVKPAVVATAHPTVSNAHSVIDLISYIDIKLLNNVNFQ